MSNNFFIEVNCQQKNHEGERICGDVFVSRYVKEENRIITVLSDGMGSGVKANLLATLTATMAINFTEEHRDVERIAEIIMNTLPVCSERKISYSTFTVVDVEYDGETRILQYDNPLSIIIRGKNEFDPEWSEITLETGKNAGKEIRVCKFIPKKEDRIIICSDGVSQSGLGGKFPFGWGESSLSDFSIDAIAKNPYISARRLAGKIINKAFQNDDYKAKDDTSCAVIYFREPRQLLICTGPPYEQEKDLELGDIFRDFKGKKIICGATTADIIARELKINIVDSFEFDDPDLPPVSHAEGIDLITEGILTLGKVTELLRKFTNDAALGKGPADQIVKLLLESDKINMIIGTRINIAHQDPTLPVELEIRRTVVKRIAKLLEEKFMKEVSLRFI